MKKILIFFLLTFFSVFTFAHSPSKIEISFNDSMDLIYVKVYHSVPSVSLHYIKSIKLSVNGSDISEQKFYKQSNKDFEETYFLFRNSETDSIIEITAFCNISGKNKTSLKISKE